MRGRRARTSERVAAQPPLKISRLSSRSQDPQHRLVALVLDRRPGGADQHELLHSGRELQRDLGADEAAHRVADDHRAIDAERVQQLVDDPPVAGDRDLLGRHRRMPEARQVHRDDAMRAGEVGDVLQPVDPGARQPVDEHDRIALADVDHVDRGARDLDPALVLAPVDVQPLRSPVGPVTVQIRGRRLRSDIGHAAIRCQKPDAHRAGHRFDAAPLLGHPVRGGSRPLRHRASLRGAVRLGHHAPEAQASSRS